ncbi:MAG: DNA polymerase III subunit beta [Eubacteriales bacterium]|nr:DNA polymerase III subunit beta [Eubacteriales bacterium]
MKFKCSQQELTRAINVVSKAVSTRTTLPVMKGILLEAGEDGVVKISASDMDLFIRTSIEAEVEEPGKTVVMAKLFSEIIRKLPGVEVTLASAAETGEDGGTLLIKSMNSSFNIGTISPDEFPVVNNVDDDQEYIEFELGTFKKMIDKTSFSASIDDARGIITGVLIDLAQDEIQMVSIDGYRMAINKSTMYNQEPHTFVIAAKVLNDISKIIADLSEDEKKGRLYLDKKKAVFLFGNIQAETRLMEGRFIDYKKIIPQSSAITVIANRTDLISSVERASLLTAVGKNNLITISLAGNTMEISSDSEQGNVKDELLVENEGGDLRIGFNAHYLLDALKAVDDEKIKIKLNTAVAPCIIEPVEEDSYLYLILPVRIK